MNLKAILKSAVIIILFFCINCKNSTAQQYHITEGFNLEAGTNVVPTGWSTDFTYPSKNANHGLYNGTRCIKFTKGYSFLMTPEFVSAGVLNFWLLLDSTNTDGNEKFYIELRKDAGSFVLIDSCRAVDNDITRGVWTEHTIEINDSLSAVQFRFTVEYTDPEGSSPKSLIYIDDVSLTNLLELSDETTDTTQYVNRFYVDAENGNDENSAKSEALAWKTLSKVSSETFKAGDTILLKCGNLWNEVFEPKGSGNVNIPIVITSYSNGNKPIIDAQGQISEGNDYSSSIRLFNQEYWHIENLNVQNYAADESDDPLQKYGIIIEGQDCGTLHGFTFNDMEICNVNGMVDERENGGLGFIITRSDLADETPSNFDGITIENCFFHDLANCGLFSQSSWSNRDFSSSFGQTASNGKINEWFPSYNIVVRNNRFEKTAGNGMVIRIADGPLVEYNTFYQCGLLTTGNASYPYNCDNALWQFNEASHTVYNNGDVDASGFDSDYFCKNTIIQYNYSHDNDWGSVLVCSNGNISRAFNDNTIVRYNVFQNDGHHSVRMSGTTTNTYIYNNVFYLGENFEGVELLWHKDWGGYSDNTNYYNNIFYNKGKSTTYNFTESTNNVFSNNIFYGNSASKEPTDPFKITSDPLFADPGKGDFGFSTTEGYKILEGSPAIGAGKRMTTEVINDFYGNEVLLSSGITIGAHQIHAELSAINNSSVNEYINVYPNPVESSTTLNIQNEYFGIVQVSILNMDGKLIKTLSFTKHSKLVSRVLNLNEFVSGTYIINVQGTEFTASQRIIKN
jgi:hypothetical protein